jgi:hypothetical protein
MALLRLRKLSQLWAKARYENQILFQEQSGNREKASHIGGGPSGTIVALKQDGD